MKISTFALAAAMTAASFGVASAQSGAFKSDPSQCMANVGALDKNGDGFLDNTEMSAYGRVETNVDVNGDGRISAQEMTVVCRDGASQALQPKS